MEKIIITGGCGFVGREFVALAKERYEVHVVDNLLCGEYRLEGMDTKDISFYNIDLRNSSAVETLVNKINPNIIVHLAAIHFIPQCEDNPELALSTNILSTVNLLKSISKEIKFIFVSSAAVYAPSLNPLEEGTKSISPLDVYGFSKLHGEDYVNLFTDRNNLNTVIVRLFNVIGPGETNPHILPEIISQLKKGSKKLNLGNIQSKRDFIDVRDVAQGLSKICSKEFSSIKDGNILNLGSGKTYSMKELLEYMSQITGIDFDVSIDKSKFRKVDNPVMLASILKLEDCLGWKPEYSILETLTETWNSPEIPPSLQD